MSEMQAGSLGTCYTSIENPTKHSSIRIARHSIFEEDSEPEELPDGGTTHNLSNFNGKRAGCTQKARRGRNTSSLVGGSARMTTMPCLTQSKKRQPVPLIGEGDPNYTLDYIVEMRDMIQLPPGWVLQVLSENTDGKCRKILCVVELAIKEDKVSLRRMIQIFENFKFKIEVNSLDCTEMFTERNSAIDSLPRLQSLITDLSSFFVCEGLSNFEDVNEYDMSLGVKVRNIWYANDCQPLSLTEGPCEYCRKVRPSLVERKLRLHKRSYRPTKADISYNNTLISRLPSNDPLILQIKIEKLEEEKQDLKKQLANSRRVKVRRSSKWYTEGEGNLETQKGSLQLKKLKMVRAVKKPKITSQKSQDTNSVSASFLHNVVESMKPTSVLKLGTSTIALTDASLRPENDLTSFPDTQNTSSNATVEVLTL